LAAVLGISDGLAVRDISRNGALVESIVPLPVESVQSLRFVLGDQIGEITVRVRHVTPIVSGGGSGRYRIGFEFLDLEPAMRDQVDRLATTGLLGSSE
jgi:hypothetical protein